MSQMLEIFSLYDKKGNDYGVPFFQITAGVARRTLCDLVSDSRSFVSAHPEDYSLYRIGYYDSASGNIESRVPEFVADAVEFLVRKGGVGGSNPPDHSATAVGQSDVFPDDEVEGKDLEQSHLFNA